MNQFRILILLIAASMLLCSCPDKEREHYYITIINQSDKTVICQPRLFKIGEADPQFHCQYVGFTILSESKYTFDNGTDTWETELNTRFYLQLVLVDRDAYLQYVDEPCDTIRKYMPVLHRYQLTLEDLERMNWTVVYPPDSTYNR